MKFLSIAFFGLLMTIQAFAQGNSFGLIKFSLPASWQQQIKSNMVSYSGTEPESNIWMEVRIFQPEAAAVKPDSSFRMVWRNVVSPKSSTQLPPIKKRYSESGLPVAYNITQPAAITEKNLALYEQLVVVLIDKQLQVIELITANEKDLKTLRVFIESFIDSLDTIAKRKD